jgi:dipicolinate synthase subunit A
MTGTILKDDARYDHTEAFLRRAGYFFREAEASPRELNFVIFPFKDKVDENIFGDEYFSAFEKNAKFFSGVRNNFVAQKCEKYGLEYFAMMEDAGTTIKNAVPTSEGVIAYVVCNMPRTIAGARILVVGYGVCGRDLATRLGALGANVCALVRNREKKCIAQADSVTPIFLGETALENFDAIINTVPAQILSNEMISRAGNALMIDIASAPYGFDMEFAKKQNNRSAILAAIPGKHAVQTAGEILGEYVDFILKGKLI